MSVVTGILMVCSLADEEGCVPAINRWLGEQYSAGDNLGNDLADTVPDRSRRRRGMGGNKHPQFYSAGAGYNGFDHLTEAFVDFWRSLPWADPEEAVLIVRPEEGPVSVHRP